MGEGLAGFEIQLTNSATGAVVSVVSDADGLYLFPWVSAGDYLVCEVQQAAWSQIVPVEGPFCSTGGLGYVISIPPGVDFSFGGDFGHVLM